MTVPRLLIAVCVLAAVGAAVVLLSPGSRMVRVDVPERVTPVPVPSPAPAKVTLMFGGDVMLSRAVGDRMAAQGDWTLPFADIASMTAAADLFFVNLETPVSVNGAPQGCGYCFRTDPRALAGLVRAGVDVVSLANNHTFDYGRAALEETLAYVAASDISAAGAGRNETEARGPVVREAGGTRIAFLAYTDLLPVSAQATDEHAGVNRYDAVRMQEDILRAGALADIVIVSFHTGTEYEPLHNAHQEAVYRAAVDAGADLVIGHHPHVFQDWEAYRDGYIFYSLGNLVFDQQWSKETRTGALVSVDISGTHIGQPRFTTVDIPPTYRVTVVR